MDQIHHHGVFSSIQVQAIGHNGAIQTQASRSGPNRLPDFIQEGNGLGRLLLPGPQGSQQHLGAGIVWMDLQTPMQCLLCHSVLADKHGQHTAERQILHFLEIGP